MRCCVDIAKFFLFLANLLFFLGFLALVSGSIYVLLRGEDSFLGMDITYDISSSNPTAIYFIIIITLIIVFSFFSIFTCLGCCGAAYRSTCMIGSYIVILFVLFGGSVGGLVFLHYQYGLDAVNVILSEEMESSVKHFNYQKPEWRLVEKAWDWLQSSAPCCGVEDNGYAIWSTATLPNDYKVGRTCCRSDHPDCMYEPTRESTHPDGCAGVILIYVQAVVYGLPVYMFISLIFAFMVAASTNKRERRRRVETRPYHSQSQYSVGAEDDFQNYSYPSAPEDPPYNPEFAEMNYRQVGVYPLGTVSPPTATAPLLHDAPPSYNEVFLRK